MKTLGLILSVMLVFVCRAKDEFGNFDSVKREHPEFFKPGVVGGALLGNVPWYVYCGDAEKCFSDEQDAELYQEAEIQAKSNFYEYFAAQDTNSAVKVAVQGARRMYTCKDGSSFYVVMGVRKSGVEIKRTPKCAPMKGPVKETGPNIGDVGNNIVPAMADQSSQREKKVSDSAEIKNDSVKGVENSGEEAHDTLSDDQKLSIYRDRLMRNPGDFRTRIRMARIFDRQGNVKRALRNYSDAARLIIEDVLTPDGEKAESVREIAVYEEMHGSEGQALKHYRYLLKMKATEYARFANGKVSQLLLKYE